MSPSELFKELASGKFRSIYYFYGSEDYRIKEAGKALVGRFLPKVQRATNHTILSAAKNKLEDILTELSVIPMLGERQIFTINDIQSFTPQKIEKILSLLEPPDPNRIVILTSPSSKLPRKTTKIFRFLLSNTTPVEFPRLKQASARSRIAKLLQTKSVQIEPEALDALAELSGGDLGGILLEVNKLIDYVGENGTITRKVISEITSDYQAFKVFELAEFAARGEYDKALSVIDFLLSRGERASALLFWISEHFIGLYLAQNRKQFGQNKRDMSWKFKGQLNLYDNEHLERIIVMISETDRDLRANIGQHKFILEKLVYHICSEKKKAANE